MNAKLLSLPLLCTVLVGCEGVIVADHYPHHYRRVVYVERPAYVVAQPAPVVVTTPPPPVAQPGQAVAPPPPAAESPVPPVAAAPPPAVTYTPAPVVVEEGAIVGNVVVVEPADIDGYVLVGDQYYYWHPGLHLWVHVHRGFGWRPGPRVAIYRGWGAHPYFRHH